MAANPVVYFDASYGGIPLLISSISTDSGRDIAVQSPARGSKHVLQDRGRRLGVSTVQVLFIDQPSQADDYLTRFDAFRTMALTDGSQVFSHPLIGSYSARISDFSFDASGEELSVRVSCKILPEDEPQLVQTTGAGVSAPAGVEAVSVASENATNALTAIGATSPVPGQCLAQVQGWSDADNLDAQQVFAEVASLTISINAAIVSLELSSDIDHWAAYQAMVLLSYQVMLAAQAASSTAVQVFDLTLTAPRPALSICADIYGAALAQDRSDAMVSMNRIRTPARVPPGTYKMVSAGAEP